MPGLSSPTQVSERRTGLPGCKDSQLMRICYLCLTGSNYGTGHTSLSDCHHCSAVVSVPGERSIMPSARGIIRREGVMNSLPQLPASHAVNKDQRLLTCPDCTVEFPAEPCHLPVKSLYAVMPPSQVKINLSHICSAMNSGLSDALKSVLKNSYFCRPEDRLQEKRHPVNHRASGHTDK